MSKLHKLFGALALQVAAAASAFASHASAAESGPNFPFKCTVDSSPSNAAIDVDKTKRSGKCEWAAPTCNSDAVTQIETLIKKLPAMQSGSEATTGHVFQTFLRLRLKYCKIDSNSEFDAPYNSELKSLECLPDKSKKCEAVKARFSPRSHARIIPCLADQIPTVNNSLCVKSFAEWFEPASVAPQINPAVTGQSSVIRDVSFAGLGALLLAIARWLLARMRRKTADTTADSIQTAPTNTQMTHVTARFINA